MGYETILYREDGRVGWLTLNTLTGETIDEMENGQHQALVEYGLLIGTPGYKEATLALIGFMHGWAAYGLSFLAFLLEKLPLVQPYATTSGSTMATSRAAVLLAFSMLRSSSGVPWRPPAMRAVCTDMPGGAMRQNSVSMVVLIEGTRSPMRPRHPYMRYLLS